MSGIAGVELKAALRKAATWGTAVQVGPNNGFLFLPMGIKKSASVKVDDSLGLYFSSDGLPGEIKVEGPIPQYLRYDGCDLLLSLFLGVAGDPVRQGATSAYSYAYKWLESIDGLFATLVKNMKNYIEEHPSVKITGITIKGERGGALQCLADVISINKTTDSAVNTLVTYEEVTILEEKNRIRFSECVFRMNDQDAVALTNSDIVYPSSFELSAKRKLTGVYNGKYRTAAPNVQDLIDEPTNDGPPELKFKLSFPRHEAVTYLSDLGSDTRKKMDITATGSLIEGEYYRRFIIQMPHLQMTNDDPQDEKGIIKEPLEYILHKAETAPAGMAGITDPFWISGINQRSSDPLTEDAAPEGFAAEALMGDGTPS